LQNPNFLMNFEILKCNANFKKNSIQMDHTSSQTWKAMESDRIPHVLRG
jgi:hypothetical protein